VRRRAVTRCSATTTEAVGCLRCTVAGWSLRRRMRRRRRLDGRAGRSERTPPSRRPGALCAATARSMLRRREGPAPPGVRRARLSDHTRRAGRAGVVTIKPEASCGLLRVAMGGAPLFIAVHRASGQDCVSMPVCDAHGAVGPVRDLSVTLAVAPLGACRERCHLGATAARFVGGRGRRVAGCVHARRTAKTGGGVGRPRPAAASRPTRRG
jgi:hypothetical protein